MTSLEEYNRRIANVRRVMEKRGVQCVLLNRGPSIKYLTGVFNTCSWVFITRDDRRVAVVLESDYLEYRARSIVEDVRTHRPHDPVRQLRALREELGIEKGGLAAEMDHLKAYQYAMVAELMGDALNRDEDADKIVEEARAVKTPDEIEAVRVAARLAIAGMRAAGEYIAAGMTETDIARRIAEAVRESGGRSETFSYVGTDGRSSLAHNPPTGRKVARGPVVVDVHTSHEGFRADMARTFFLDDPEREQTAAYEYLRDALLRTYGTVKAGVALAEVRRTFFGDFKPREDWIVLYGPLLHGIGVMGSELPRFQHPWEGPGYLPILEANETIASSNIGLCSKKGWGVRYEDTLLVTETGCENLTAGY